MTKLVCVALIRVQPAIYLILQKRIKPLFFKEHPQLIQLIKLSIEKSVNEWISPVIERAIKIAVTTCEQIVKKVDTAFCKVNLVPHLQHFVPHGITSCVGM